MENQLSTWQLVLLVLFLPPIGVYFVCTRPDIRLPFKIAAVIYFLAAFIAALSIRRPVGEVYIDAERLA